MKYTSFKIFILLLFGCQIVFAKKPSKHSIDLLLKWESSLPRTYYLYLDSNATNMRFKPIIDFADIPLGDRWYVENNSYGMMAYMAGVKKKDEKLKAYGIEILNFAMKQQQADAQFPEKNDIHHSLAFYYEMIARFLLITETKELKDDVTPEVKFRLKSGLRKGAIWFAKQSSWDDEFWRDYYHHRFLLNASVILLAQSVCNDLPQETLEQAYKWLKIAENRQLPTGIMTEHGGHDTGYQSLGITFSVGILLLCDLPKNERIALENLVKNGTDWLLTRVSNNGEIDGTGNTRMGGTSKELNRTDGKPKGIKPYEHAFAILGAAYYFNNTRYKIASDSIMSFYK